jgi:putative ABC transport system permease protein
LPRAYAAAGVLVSRPESDGASWSAEATDDIATRLGALGSVVAAVPDRSFYAQLVLDGRAQGDPTGGPYGHAWSVVRLSGAQLLAGRGPEHDGEVALGADLGPAVGDRVSVLTATGPSTYTVTGVVSGSGIYLDEATARRLAGGVRVVGLVTTPGADIVSVAEAARSIVGQDGHVLTGSARTALEPPRDRQIRADAGTLLSVMASLSAFVSIFVVASTFALAVSQRRREFGLLRTIGATPRQIRRTLFAEALLVGVLASAAGAGLGIVLINPYAVLLQRARLLPGLSVQIPLWTLAVSAGVGLFVAVCGVWSASRRAGKVAPLEALREAAVEKRPMTPARWFLGLAVTALGVALVWTSAAATADAAVTTAMFSAMALILGLTLLAPTSLRRRWHYHRPLSSCRMRRPAYPMRCLGPKPRCSQRPCSPSRPMVRRTS